MLSINDYNYLKLLYDKFFKSNAHIRALIKADDWDSVDIAVQEKESLIRQIIFFEKTRLEDIKANISDWSDDDEIADYLLKVDSLAHKLRDFISACAQIKSKVRSPALKRGSSKVC